MNGLRLKTLCMTFNMGVLVGSRDEEMRILNTAMVDYWSRNLLEWQSYA